MSELAKKIVRYRAQKGLSQDEFAKAVGLSNMTVSNIENGKHEPYRTTAERISQYIDKENKKENDND